MASAGSPVGSIAKSIEVERLGLSLLHSPVSEHTAGDEPIHSANIIFVHGLRGHPQTTWEYKPARAPSAPKQRSSKEEKTKQKRSLFSAFSSSSRHQKKPSRERRDQPAQSIFWPAHILPQELSQARIWTYGYDADVISGIFRANNKNSILQHANDLTVKLERTLDDRRPIIFVAHSLGGIIVKRALSEMESSKEESLMGLLNRVFAVVFCGCPHRGADAAAWGILLSKLATVALAAPTAQLLSDLEIDSQILDMIQDNFLRTLQYQPSLRVHSFLEGKGMTGIKGLDGKIVDDFSGKIGWLKGARYETIDADHREMVREPGVKDITSVLKILEKDSSDTGEHYDIPYEAFPYLNSFHTFDYDSILDNIIDPYRHTCTWIPKSQAFLKWIAGESSTTFWLHGYPGLGKSVITKYLLKNFIDIPAVDNRSRRCVLYFFCSYNLSNAQSYKGMLSSLIYQLLSQRPDLAGHATSLKNQFGWIDPDVDSLTNLHKIFADLLYWYTNSGRNMTRYGSLSAVPTLYIVIDALDELNRSEWSRFFETFGEILHGRLHGTRNTLIRLLITSRTEPEFEDQLAKVWDIDLGATDQNASDVVEYIKGTVSDFGHQNNFGDENIHEIISEISTKAEGMFLWATLAWSLFTDGIGMWTRGLVQQKLEGLRQVPAGIESLYHRVLGLLDKRIAIELLAALKWIVAAPVPLSVDDIAVALSLRTRPRNSRQLDKTIPFNMRRFFKKACPHLIKVDGSGLIKLVHLSFRTYLLETEFANIGSQKVPNPFHFALAPVNYDIGLDCLSYITLDDFAKESLEEAQQHLFFSYCHRYWIHHLQSIKDGFDNVFVYFFKLFNFETKKLRWYDTSKMIFQLWDSGLSRLFEPAARFGMDLNVFDESGDHFIHHVCNGPNGIEVIEDTTRWLVDLGVDLNGRTYFGQTLLHRCLMNWHDALCHPDIDTPMATELIGNILHIKKRPFEIALDSARDSCRRLLSHPSIDLNAPDSFRFSPLSYAIYWGMTDAMKMLLACPYLRAEKGHSALHIAAKEGLYDAVEQLLKRGTDVYGRNSQGETALHLAAAGGHFRILQLLVSYADPTLLNAKDRIIDPMSPYANGYIITTEANGWTPLHLAVTSGHDDLVLWLINHPWIDLHIKDKHGRKAIAFAAAFGTKSMLKAFLARDPSQVTHKDLFGNGLLHMASWGSNRENFDLLFSLDVTPAFGPNKWGNSIVDLAPTLAVDEHLHELGFVHSEARKASCLVVLGRHLQLNKLTLEELTHRKYQPSEPQDLTGSKMIMVIPGSAEEYRDYAFRTVESILDWVSYMGYTGHSWWYPLRTADIILKRLSMKVGGQTSDLNSVYRVHKDEQWTAYGPDHGMQRFKDIFARQGRFEAGYDQKDDLQKLKDNIDCLLAADDDWKDDLRRLKGRLDLL